MSVEAEVTIHFTCVSELPLGPGETRDCFTDQLGPGSVVAVTAFPLAQLGDYSVNMLRVENVCAVTTAEHSDFSFEVHCTVRNIGPETIERFQINFARIRPAGGVDVEPCREDQ